ncbi:hypothetical protein [Galactobacter valiniphilus]|uniref:hypothetical protein n=1 Tax=Galactobacter valiniphilus TaxID=2676122 RepID=UPI003735A993
MQEKQRGGKIAAKVQAAQAASGTQGEQAASGIDAHAPEAKNHGLGRIIIAVYGVFALSAFARSLWQLVGSEHGEKIFPLAPVAIVFSMIAAVVYIVATISLALPKRRAWYVALVAVLVEIVGVLAVSILSYAEPQLFPKASVWSHFGQGYGYVPLVLPFVGLWWLLTHRPRSAKA